MSARLALDGHLLPVFCQGKERAMSLLILIRMSVPSWGPTLMASSNLNNLSKAPPPNSVSLAVKPLSYELLGNKHWAITAKTLSKAMLGSTVARLLFTMPATLSF